ncbi:hypothetical protein BKI52_11170 [marine bacterium AO1-C]|nr:hypothetical protein BKI52_11170 [marine bacterium AO1-C]
MKSFIIYCQAWIAAQYRKLPEKVKQLPWVTYIYRLVYTLFFFLIFFLLQDKIESWFISKISPYLQQKTFEWNTLFESVFFIAFLVVVPLYVKRFPKFKAIDFIIIGLYLYYSFGKPDWFFFQFKWGLAYWDLLWVVYIAKVLVLIYRNLSIDPPTSEVFLDFDLSLDKFNEKDEQGKEIDNDQLGRTIFAKELAKTIVKIRSEYSVVIGINGEWGSGKTSLIHLVKEQLKKKEGNEIFKGNRKKHKIFLQQTLFIDFTPWYFSNTDALVANFFGLLEQKVRPFDTQLSREVSQYGKHFRTIEKTFLKTQIINDFITSAPKDFKTRFDTLQKAIKKSGKTFIITIDDLDRLRKSEIVDVLKLVRIIADFPNTIYLLSYDREYIVELIGDELSQKKAHTFLEKILQLEFKVPMPDSGKLIEILQEHLKDKMEVLFGEQFDDKKKKKLLQTINLPLVKDFIKNLRDIKRLSNNFLNKLLLPDVLGEINIKHFFLLELIDYVNDEEHQFLYESIIQVTEDKERSVIVERVRAKYEEREKEDYKGKKTPSRIKKVIDYLSKIEEVNSKNALFNELHYFKYFSLSLSQNDFSEKKFKNQFGKNTLNDSDMKELKKWTTNNPGLLLERIKYLKDIEEGIPSLIIQRLLIIWESRYEHVISLKERFYEDEFSTQFKKAFADTWKANGEDKVLDELKKKIDNEEEVNDKIKGLLKLMDVQLARLIDDSHNAYKILIKFNEIAIVLLKSLISSENSEKYIDGIIELMNYLDHPFYQQTSTWYKERILEHYHDFLEEKIFLIFESLERKFNNKAKEEDYAEKLFSHNLFKKDYFNQEGLLQQIYYQFNKKYPFVESLSFSMDDNSLDEMSCGVFNIESDQVILNLNKPGEWALRLVFFNEKEGDLEYVDILKDITNEGYTLTVNGNKEDETLLAYYPKQISIVKEDKIEFIIMKQADSNFRDKILNQYGKCEILFVKKNNPYSVEIDIYLKDNKQSIYP